jgi:hypothetical protein
VWATVLSTALLVTAGGASTKANATEESTIEEIREELLQLPYYGVFDFLAFSYDKGQVTLMGYANRPTLKKDAERAVKRVAGVDEVVDRVEELPVSFHDDDLRWATYYKIYRDPFLSRYAPGGGMLWGRHNPFLGSPFHPLGSGPFLGMEPVGDYPIHIVVKNGRITLLGVVDNESDKTMAGMRAREVNGSFGVDNQLMIESDEMTSR